MNLSSILKPAAIVVLALGVTIGCTQQQQKPAPAEQPSAAELAIQAAKDANKKAKAVGFAWRDTGKIIKKAEAALKKGDEKTALKLANQARFQAEEAVRQYNYEQGIDRSLSTAEKGSMSYTVERGDHLWGISSKDSVYGDPYQWPLIYKANSDKIKDADLIFPGQELDIDSSPSADDVSAAVNHAKTRGAWSLGAVESSDQAYLGQ